MKTFKAKITTLFILTSILASNPFLDFKIQQADIFQPLLKNESIHQVEQAYRLLFRTKLGYELQNTGKIAKILAEIANLDSKSLRSNLQYTDQEYLETVLKKFFIVNQFKIQENSDLEKEVEELAQNYSVKLLQLKIDGVNNVEGAVESVNSFINIDLITILIKSTFELFAKNDGTFVPENLRTSILNKIVKKFKGSVKERFDLIDTIISFKENHRKHGLETINNCIEFVMKLESAQDQNQIDLIVQKLMTFVKFIKLTSVHEEEFDFAFRVGQMLTQDINLRILTSRSFVDKMMTKLMKMFSKTSNLVHIRQGKEIFISYFTDIKKYGEPNSHYLAFITKKYNSDGLKFESQNYRYSYDRMLRIYVIDVIHASLFMKTELLKDKDLKSIFLSFSTYASWYNYEEQEFFKNLRVMILNSGETVIKLYALFNSLYDSFLHSSQYFSSGIKQFFSKPRNYAILYNDYLDYMHDWTNSYIKNTAYAWQPAAADFKVNINENYVFFKLINMHSNMRNLFDNVLSFRNFKEQNNYWIHKYVALEHPRKLLNYLKNGYFAEGGFNYQNLRNLNFPKTMPFEYFTYSHPMLEIKAE